MRSFQECCKILDTLGWRYSVAQEYRGHGNQRVEHSLELFSRVSLPLTAQDWVRILAREPCEALATGEIDEKGKALYQSTEYLGDFGGALSKVQALLADCLIEHGGRMSAWQLVETGNTVRESLNRDPNLFEEEPTDKTFAALFENRERLAQMSAWSKIALLYHLVKDYSYCSNPPVAQPRHFDDLERALRTVQQLSFAFGFDLRPTFDSIKTATQRHANRIMWLTRFIPALKLVGEQIQQVCPKPVEGWALYDREEEGVAENAFGLCIYASQEEASRILDPSRQTQNAHEDEVCTPRVFAVSIDERYQLRPVRVSFEKGLEFLDAGEQPKPYQSIKRRRHWLPEESSMVEDTQILFEHYASSRTELRKLLASEDSWCSPTYVEAMLAWEEASRFFRPEER